MAEEPGVQRIGGGGAAAGAGMLFQAQVGAEFAFALLTQTPMDDRLGLGGAKPIWLRFETEAAVDDILVATSAGGFVAIQVKTTATVSANPDSPFGKTVAQFVRHWLACRDGDGSLTWNRALDPSTDRLVLAVGKGASATMVGPLPEALRIISQPGSGALNLQQEQAFGQFESCVRSAWSDATSEPYDPNLAPTLAGMIRVLVFDPEQLKRFVALSPPGGVFATSSDAVAALNALEQLSLKQIATRGGADRASLRANIAQLGIRLPPPADYRADIARLQTLSSETALSMSRYEVVEAAEGQPVSITRDCEGAVRDAALGGPLLIVGEPGSGKSGVLNALARDLREGGHDVVELAVDRYSIETLEGLGQDLGLSRGFLDVLEAWDGPEPGWLIIDALDATRGGKGERVFRTLIERVIDGGSRWRVVASIRSFDLRMGQQFRALFKGEPPVEGLRNLAFPDVRHIEIPSWSVSEFEDLLRQIPALENALGTAPAALRDIATVPFNTRLLCELIKDGLVTDFRKIGSQAELLQLYWRHRVETHGGPAQACILRIVDAMVDSRALRAPFAVAAGSDAATLDLLEGEGVLISGDNRRWIQFRHHLLFDFAAARVLLDPSALIRGRQRFPKGEARGLMLAPALNFVLSEIWARDLTRAEFWLATGALLADGEGDPVIRSAVARITAELPSAKTDLLPLASRVVANDCAAIDAFIHLSGALAVRLEDDADVPVHPWTGLLREIAPNVAPIARTVQFLLHKLIKLATSEEDWNDIGYAARALFAHALTMDESHGLISIATDFVANSFTTNPTASRDLLVQLFDPARLEEHAFEDVPALCREIGPLAAADPDFAVRIYRETYGFSVDDNRETLMSRSQILGLRSNARQDYDMARYSLGEYLPQFLREQPAHAVDAIIAAVEGYVTRAHPRNPESLDTDVQVGSRTVRVREDWSYIWAASPDEIYGHDGDFLILKLLEHLRSAEMESAVAVAEQLIDGASLAVFWSRLFLAAAEREGALLQLLLPFAMQETFLTLPDTRKDAIDVVAKGYCGLTHETKEQFEQSVARFNFDCFAQPEGAREGLERRLFSAIGETNLATAAARLKAQQTNVEGTEQNDRLFTSRASWRAMEPYHWIADLDQGSPSNQALMQAIERTKEGLDLESDATQSATPSLGEALDILETLASQIDRLTQNEQLVIYAEEQIALGLARQVDGKALTDADGPAIARFLRLFAVPTRSIGPEVADETEAQFEQSASWSTPAPRIRTAGTILDLARERPDLYGQLEAQIDDFLRDSHPAVRMEASLHLLRIWEVDRAGFWRRLSERMRAESNLSVLDYVVNNVLGRVLRVDPALSEALLLDLLGRFPSSDERQARVRKTSCNLIAVLWIWDELAASHQILTNWIATPASFHVELLKILGILRGPFVEGLAGEIEPDDQGIRHRAHAFALAIAQAANQGLAPHFGQIERTDKDIELARHYAQILDAVCRELYFACGASRSTDAAPPALTSESLRRYFAEITPILEAIGDYATPHTIYYLLQLLEYLMSHDPARAFDLVSHALRNGGQKHGYQYESLGADLLVRMVGVFLADHRELFDDEVRRGKLIECLEMFMEAGWPAARRLLYRLPELIQ